MSYQGARKEFEVHPQGQHEGIVYMWKDRGIIPTHYGDKHRGLIGIESISSFMTDGRPYIIVESVNIAFGKKARLRERREQILGRPLTDDEAYDFDPRELMEARVGYVVKHREEEDSVWANIDALWRVEDQGKGTLVNDIVVLEEAPEKASGEVSEETSEETSESNGDPGIERQDHALRLLDRLADSGLVSQDEAGSCIAKVQAFSTENLALTIKRWEDKLSKAGVSLPVAAGSTGGDDLPF
jgi:hypothetical protein